MKPPNAVPPSTQETRHKLYVSNLAWKARSTHLREFFTAADFNLVSARVVFADPGGRASGYGFVSFPSREEAEDAISKLDGKVSSLLYLSLSNVQEIVRQYLGRFS